MIVAKKVLNRVVLRENDLPDGDGLMVIGKSKAGAMLGCVLKWDDPESWEATLKHLKMALNGASH